LGLKLGTEFHPVEPQPPARRFMVTPKPFSIAELSVYPYAAYGGVTNTEVGAAGFTARVPDERTLFDSFVSLMLFELSAVTVIGPPPKFMVIDPVVQLAVPPFPATEAMKQAPCPFGANAPLNLIAWYDPSAATVPVFLTVRVNVCDAFSFGVVEPE
jgi:hypothetical protein